jgi:hypothetical protein
MKKQLNSDAIANELRGNSAFFPRYKEPSTPDPVVEQTPVLPEPVTTPPSSPQPITVPSHSRDIVTSERPNGRTPTRTPERPARRRIITRNSFEIYEDQMESLRKLSYKEKMEGGVGSMSRMVRDAIDHYLTTNAPPEDEPERPND